MPEPMLKRRVSLLGITLAVSYWLIETVADSVFGGEGPVATRLFPADANEVWMRLIIVALILGFTRYVSYNLERRARTERRLRILQSAVEHTDDAVLITTAKLDPPGPEIVYVNEALCRQTGYAAKELLGETPRKLQGPDSDREVLDELRKCLECKQHFVGNLTNYRKDGSSFRVELRISPVYDSARNVTHWISVQHDVTERERAEAALKESEERYRLLIESAEDYAIFMVDPDGRILSWNEGAGRVFGYSEEEIVGEDGSLLFTPEDRRRGATEEELRRAESEGRAGNERWHMRKDGSRFWGSGFVRPVRDDAGSLRGFSKVVRDATERKRAEEALRHAEENYRSIFENAVEGIFQTSLDGRVVRVNPAGARIFGYDSPEEAIAGVADVGRQLYADPADRAQFDSLIRQHGVVTDFETRMYRKDGSVIWVSLNAHAIRSSEGELLGFEGTIEDVTERKRAREALQDSEERYRAVVEQSAEGIYLIDAANKRIIETNSPLQQMLGYTASELRGMEIYELVARPREELDSSFQRTLKEKRRLIDDVNYRRKDGTLLDVEVGASVIRYGGNDVVCVVARDITERKRAERGLREAEERYRRLVEQVPAVIYTQELSEPGSAESNPTIYASPQIEAQTGYPPQAFVEDSELWIKLIHPEDRERVLAEDARTGETGEPFRVDYRLICRNGQVIWVRDEAMLVRDEHGQPLHWQGIQQDITERKRAESALREVREAERRQIARDLHDEVLQELMDALYSMQLTRMKLRDEEIDIPEIDEQIDDLRKATNSLRDAINNLRHESIHKQPFLHLLRSVVVANRQKAPHIEIDLDVDASFASQCLGSIGIELLRIIQEALVNVRRHSWARRVRVSLREEGDFLTAEVVDDGRGFDPEMSWGGVGTSAMQERASKLGSELEIHSEPGRGCRVTVRVPTALVLAVGTSGNPSEN